MTEWNELYKALTRLQGGARARSATPGPMFNLAMFDAVNGIDRVEISPTSFQPYLTGLPPFPSPASREAAARRRPTK